MMIRLNKIIRWAGVLILISPCLSQANSVWKWSDANNLPKGAKLAIIAGNPNKKEFYVARLKLPANFAIPVHSHLTAEYNTVISGTYYLGIGKKTDKQTIIALPLGSFVSFPAGAIHYGYTKEETVLEISGIGPWATAPRKL